MKVLLIGDPMEDINHFCKVRDVICREAPIPILDEVSTDTRPGGASNVFANMKALGLKVEFIRTSTVSKKHRIWVEDRLVCRYDQDGAPVPEITFATSGNFDAVVISDYQKGYFSCLHSYPFSKFVPEAPMFVDTKSPMPYHAFDGADFIFPSVIEWPAVQSHRGSFKHVIRKDGEKGCFVDGQHVPTESVHGADTVGAGDVFLACFVAYYLQSPARNEEARMLYAAEMANKGAGISCTRRGTTVVSLKDMEVFA